MQITGTEPAYPLTSEAYNDLDKGYNNTTMGLTIRQHFAALAMQGILANSPDWGNTEVNLNWVSDSAVKFADALIKELNK